MPIFSFTYSIPYVCLFTLLLIFAAFEQRMRARWASLLPLRFVWGAVFVLFFGLRGFVGEDWSNYFRWFEQRVPTLWETSLWHIFTEADTEPGFYMFMSLIKTLIPSYFAFVFCSVLITFLVLDSFFTRYSRYYCFSFIAFMAFLGMGIMIDAARNLLSIMIFITSIPYIVQRKIVPYYGLNILGCLFHTSSVVYLLIYPFVHKRFPQWLLITIFIVCNVVFIFQVQFIRPVLAFFAGMIDGRINALIESYSNIQTAYGLSFGFVERNIMFVFVILFYNRLANSLSCNRVMANFYVLYFSLFCLFAEIGVVAIRMSMLFIMSYWILYPNIYAELKQYGNKVLFLLFYVTLSGFKILIGTQMITYKYENLLWGIETYSKRVQNVLKPYQRSVQE